MIVMAVGTTAMTGPLVKLFYPDRLMQRDVAEADRVRLGGVAEHRILVLIGEPAAAGPLVDLATGLAASREHSQLILSHLVAHAGRGLEVGAGLGSELIQMTQAMTELQSLAERAAERGVQAVVQSRFSEDVPHELPGFVAAAEPDTVVLQLDGADGAPLGAAGQLSSSPSSGDHRRRRARSPWLGRGTRTVLPLCRWRPCWRWRTSSAWCSPQAAGGPLRWLPDWPGGAWRRARPPPPGALLVAAAGVGGDAHLTVVAGHKEGSDDLDQWVQTLDRSRML